MNLLKTANIIFLSFIFLSCFGQKKEEYGGSLVPLSFEDIKMEGELLVRTSKNFDRLETEIYHPENVFPEIHHVTSQGWPGDKEGRTILGLTLLAQATHREPLYLRKMIEMIPSKVNKMGYLGPIYKDTIDEQQLSGHGWFLRGLCEYYLWQNDIEVKKHILNIVQNLALPTRGYHKNYPINPEDRRINVGEMAGTTQNVIGNWLLSSDVGCDFIFLDGLIQAYSLFPSKELQELIEEMINRFLEIDLVKIKAQTHATLTAMRSLLRYYTINQDVTLLQEVEKRYRLYRTIAMTENYENFNWFDRPEWTEPCAIIDSYILAVQLWQFTLKPEYLEDAHNIYYNAICHTQRVNGGFGCDNCTRSEECSLKVKEYEAFWCCTMRGGEGLSRAIQYSYFTNGENVYLPFFHSGNANFLIEGKQLHVEQKTDYPFDSKISLKIDANSPAKISLSFFAPSWTKNHSVIVDGKQVKFSQKNGFVVIPLKISKSIEVKYSFDMVDDFRKPVNDKYTTEGNFSLRYGPLILGYQGDEEITFESVPCIIRENRNLWKIKDGERAYNFTPVYHLLSKEVKGDLYKKQILFKIK